MPFDQTNPSELLALANSELTGTTDPALLAETTPAATETPVPTPAAATPAAATPTETKEAVGSTGERADGIATKDGKHVIPYSVLEGERRKAADATNRLADVQRQVDELTTRLAAQQTNTQANNGATPGTSQTAEAPLVSEEELAELEENFPTVAKGVRAALKTAEALKAQLAPVQETVEQQRQREETLRQQTVQEAVDATPKLAHVQANDPEAYALAVKFDQQLRETAAWANKPMAERFAKVVELVEGTLGEIALPSSGQTAAPSKDGLAAAAAAKIAKEAPAAVPTSLSSFPAGAAPATSEAQAIEQMTHAQLAEKIAKMTPAQQMEYFSNL